MRPKLMFALFCLTVAGCGEGQLTGPWTNARNPNDPPQPCNDPQRCCAAEMLQCFGDVDRGATCTCTTSWDCDAERKKCEQNQQVPGTGDWDCTWTEQRYSCEKPGDANEMPRGGVGWECKYQSETQRWRCSKSAPNPDNDPSGSGEWRCRVSEGKLRCDKPTATISPPPTTNSGGGCPATKQSLLVLDFRCGWWSAAGGAFFSDAAFEALQGKCKASVDVSYHHYVGSGDTTVPGQARPPSDWSTFDQIWVLSGSSDDGSDLPVDSSEFKAIVAKLQASQAALFVGAGDGFISHGSAVSKALALGTNFAASQNAGFFIYTRNTRWKTKLTVGNQLDAHPLFAGLTSIADQVTDSTNGQLISGSELSQSDLLVGNGLKTIGRCGVKSQPCIAVGDQGGRKIVLDSGMQRFYAIPAANDQTAKDTLSYLKNIIVYLSQ